MPLQSVEAVFDPATDAEVRRRWQLLADAGLPSQAGHAGSSNAPHLTLSAALDVPASVDEALETVVTAPGVLPLACRLGALTVLGGRRFVVACLVVPSLPLVRLHAAMAEAMGEADGVPGRAQPGLWTPHVTLARGVDRSLLGDVVEALGQVDELDAKLTQVRRWNPAERRVWPVGLPSSEPTMRG